MVVPVSANHAAHLITGGAHALSQGDLVRAALAKPASTSLPPSAIGMPTAVQSPQAVDAMAHLMASAPLRKSPERRHYHPQGAPSAVLTENFFAARQIATPASMHNMAATRAAYTSDLSKLAPRFTQSVALSA